MSSIRYTTAILLFLLAGFRAFPEDARFGYISSLSLGWYSGSGWDRTLEEQGDARDNPLVGCALGILAEKPLTPSLALRGALVVSALGGGMILESPEGGKDTLLISEISLALPALLKWSVYHRGRASFYLVGGPQIDALLYQAQFDQEGAEFHKTVLERDQFTPFGAGAVGGLGMDVAGWRFSLFMEVNYYREFTSSMDGPGQTHQNALSFASGIRWRDLL